jgi:carbonic anhydrase/acetyltransferase-like protein (isoleucine patch superfamily)
VVHGAPGFPVEIGDGVTVGHSAIIHGCKVGSHTLIGMGAIVLNGAVIGSHCVIGAGSLVTGGTVIPDGSVVVGSPAKVISAVSEKHLDMIRRNAEEYIKLMKEYRDGDIKNESLR